MWPLSSFCKRSVRVVDIHHLLSPVRDQQQISTSRKGMCAVVLLTSPSIPRLYRLKTRTKSSHSQSRPAHAYRHARGGDPLRLNITKQVVQMHSTATEVGTLVDGKNRLAKKLTMFKFHEWREDEAEIRSSKSKTQEERYARGDGCGETEPGNGNEDTEI